MQQGELRLKGVQLAIPVITGTCAFHLSKKANDAASHRWIVYLRSHNGEDLSHCFKKVVFVLHESFPNPERAVESPPYELTEHGWGEFEIAIQLFFSDDAMEQPVELLHRLRLFDDSGNISIKKPVVYEVFEEVVMWEPTEAFYKRVTSHQPRPAPPSQLAQFYTNFNPENDYRRVQMARQRVAQITANVKANLASIEAEVLAIS